MVRPGKAIDLQALEKRVLSEGAASLLTRGEAAALVAKRLMVRGVSQRTLRNRIGMQLDRARKKGREIAAGGISVSADGRYTVDEIFHFFTSRRKRQGLRIVARLEDLPHEERRGLTTGGSGRSSLPGLESGGLGMLLPGSVRECHRELITLQAEVHRLREELRTMEARRRAELSSRFRRK